ncbi:hypothetical protein D915_009971 [Fasciola hepatica]|uniref:Uncharacterized protein n=1 Tax=Fasciola hepatica TaxID=6192 RepID=A0A4E0QYD1_FASHE|nr:hypothetical protein D915_009971 [Fasciola hepatica]
MDSYEVRRLHSLINKQEIDELNDETFGAAEDGDWELEHERFALAQNNSEHAAPDADQLPKFWEASEDVSLLWQPDALDSYKSFFDDEGRERGVNVEETLQKLVSEDEAFEDPAILDISKKVPHHKLSGSALDKLLGAPAFPAAPVSLFSSSGDIWSSETIANRPSIRSQQKAPVQNASINLMDLIHQIAQTKGSSKVVESAVKSQTAEVLASHIPLPGVSEPHHVTLSPSLTMRTPFPPNKTRLDFDALANAASHLSQSDLKSVTGSGHQAATHTSAVNVPWLQRTELSSPHLTSSLLQKQANLCLATIVHFLLVFQRLDPTQLLSMIGTANPNSTASSTVGNYGQNNIPVYLRASALHLLLMQTQKARISGRPLTSLPDPRYFQLMPPPVVPAVAQVPAPLLGPQPFMGSGQVNRAATVFQGSPSPNVPFPFPMQQSSNQRVLPPDSLPLRPLPDILSVPRANHQRFSAARDGSVLGNFPNNQESVDEEFDPNKGSWMSDFESVGVLLMHLRPLMVSNPYVQDYYFAVCWLRRMTLARAKQIANGQITLSYPPPVMHMPSPVTLDHLSDPTHYQHTAQHIRFVMPMAVLPRLNKRLELSDSGSPTTGDPSTGDKAEELKTTAGPVKLSTGENTALGRPTRSNVYRPRVVIELSLASALSSDAAEITPHPTEPVSWLFVLIDIWSVWVFGKSILLKHLCGTQIKRKLSCFLSLFTSEIQGRFTYIL